MSDPEKATFEDTLAELINREEEKGTPVEDVLQALKDAIMIVEDNDWGPDAA